MKVLTGERWTDDLISLRLGSGALLYTCHCMQDNIPFPLTQGEGGVRCVSPSANRPHPRPLAKREREAVVVGRQLNRRPNDGELMLLPPCLRRSGSSGGR